MAYLETLLEKRARAWDASQAIRDRLDGDEYEPTAEDEGALRKALDETEELTRQIETAERERRLAAVDYTPHPKDRTPENERTPDEALRMEKRYGREFGIYLRTGRVGTQLAEGYRAQAEGTLSAGGYLVPTGFRRVLLDVQKAYGGLEQYSEGIETTEGNSLPWPVVDDTSNGAEYIGENVSTDTLTGADLEFSQVTLAAYTLAVKPIRISFQLMQDSAFNLDTFVPEKMGIRFGRKIANEIINGDGSSHVTGLINGVSADVTLPATSTGGFVDDSTHDSYGALVDLEHSVDIAYRRNARWLMNDLVVASARKIRDANRHPLWEPSLQAGQPDRLMGYPIIVDNAMPTFAASALVAGFGDWGQAYVVRRVRDIIAMRLVERYAEVGQVGFLAFERVDGKPTLTAARAFLAAPAA